MPGFEISYPVVGSIRLATEGAAGQVFTVADTYFDPLMEAAIKALWSRGTPEPAPPRLLVMWQERTGAFDVEGGSYPFDPADGLVPILEQAATILPELPIDKLQSVDRRIPASLDEVRLALIEFLNLGIQSNSTMTVDDLP